MKTVVRSFSSQKHILSPDTWIHAFVSKLVKWIWATWSHTAAAIGIVAWAVGHLQWPRWWWAHVIGFPWPIRGSGSETRLLRADNGEEELAEAPSCVVADHVFKGFLALVLKLGLENLQVHLSSSGENLNRCIFVYHSSWQRNPKLLENEKCNTL